MKIAAIGSQSFEEFLPIQLVVFGSGWEVFGCDNNKGVIDMFSLIQLTTELTNKLCKGRVKRERGAGAFFSFHFECVQIEDRDGRALSVLTQTPPFLHSVDSTLQSINFRRTYVRTVPSCLLCRWRWKAVSSRHVDTESRLYDVTCPWSFTGTLNIHQYLPEPLKVNSIKSQDRNEDEKDSEVGTWMKAAAVLSWANRGIPSFQIPPSSSSFCYCCKSKFFFTVYPTKFLSTSMSSFFYILGSSSLVCHCHGQGVSLSLSSSGRQKQQTTSKLLMPLRY